MKDLCEKEVIKFSTKKNFWEKDLKVFRRSESDPRSRAAGGRSSSPTTAALASGPGTSGPAGQPQSAEPLAAGQPTQAGLPKAAAALSSIALHGPVTAERGTWQRPAEPVRVNVTPPGRDHASGRQAESATVRVRLGESAGRVAAAAGPDRAGRTRRPGSIRGLVW